MSFNDFITGAAKALAFVINAVHESGKEEGKREKVREICNDIDKDMKDGAFPFGCGMPSGLSKCMQRKWKHDFATKNSSCRGCDNYWDCKYGW